MLRIQTRHRIGSAIQYFLHEPALSEAERRGIWYGAGCADAGVQFGGAVTEEALAALMAGHHPTTKHFLGLRKKPERRACWDVVMAPHKSVSIAALCLGPKVSAKVAQAWRATCESFVELIDRLASRQNGGAPLVRTGNSVVATFHHERSRHGDPHFHTHFLVMNVTLDRAAQRGAQWRALEPSPIFHNNVLLETAFNRELCRNLRNAGVAASLDAKGKCVVDTIGKAPCDKLSKAHFLIKAMSAQPRPPELGTMNPRKYENYVNDRTRPPKGSIKPLPAFDKVLSHAELAQLRTAVQRRRPDPVHDVTPTLEVAQRTVGEEYRRNSLFYSPRAMIRAVARTLRERIEWLMWPVLDACRSIREPDRSRAPAPVTTARKAAALRMLQARYAARRITVERTERIRAAADAARAKEAAIRERTRQMLEQRARERSRFVAEQNQRRHAAVAAQAKQQTKGAKSLAEKARKHAAAKASRGKRTTSAKPSTKL